MLDKELRSMIGKVKDGRMDRRAFIKRMAAVGLTAPLANQILAIGGVAMAQSPSPYPPTKRGGGGPLKLLWWQGPTLLNPHFATGTKDQDGSRLFYEPLASWDVEGHLNPILAAEIPSTKNGGLAADGKSVTWKIKPGVKWHDGKPLTADDFVFTWAYVSDPATAAVSISTYADMTVEKVDDLTIRILFKNPTPFWANAFVGAYGCVMPKHLFADYKGSKSREAPANLAPVGTGPYKFVEFKPGDLIRGELNPDYHMPNRPHFDTIEMKGGRRCRLRGASGDPDRRIRFRLEHAGRGRSTAASREGWQGQDHLCRGRRHRVHCDQLHRSEHRG
jgi:peptide/nickel transport system substrate-binding protein